MDNNQENITNQQSQEIDKCEKKLMSTDIHKGLLYLTTILDEVGKIIKHSEEDNLFYQNSWFIFRGISQFYDESGSTCPTSTRIEDEIKLVQNDYIKSSLSVRLRNTSSTFVTPNTIRTYYVDALEEMIRKAKNMYPSKYTSEMNDLDILADIQHYGGATCLVDFSKNVLTAIWFACNSVPTSNGFLYCYNVMKDMIINDAITHIRPKDENRKISSLIAQTYKETNVCSDTETKFCLWEPSKKNNRIFRQDSVFLFGIEKFKVNKHAIDVIGIKAEWKLPILSAMKALFNISGSTIFSDYFGFANNMNKTNPYKKMRDSVYVRGYMSMIKGDYNSALDFLKLSETRSCSWDDMRKLELHFSLGVCYKNLSRQDEQIHYVENAILEYDNVIILAKKIVEKSNSNSGYYKHKAIRSYNQIINLFCKLKRYEHAKQKCTEFIAEIKDGWLKGAELINGKKVSTEYCELSLLEFELLNVLTNYKDKNSFCEIYDKQESLHSNSNKFDEIEEGKYDFFLLLKEYYKKFAWILRYSQSYDNVQKLIVKWKECTDKYFEENEYNHNYILWNFADIKSAIDSIDRESWLFAEKEKLQDLTAGIIGLRDSFEMHYWWGNENI